MVCGTWASAGIAMTASRHRKLPTLHIRDFLIFVLLFAIMRGLDLFSFPHFRGFQQNFSLNLSYEGDLYPNSSIYRLKK
jgi:hypothetical protein